jgi:hypothetical protein
MKRVFIATGILALGGGLGTAALTASCDTVCTLEAVPSVIVQIIDSTDTAHQLTADSVTYTVTDPTGATETHRGECLDDECTEWILGYEVEGDYTITAEVCGQTYTGQATVEMDDDGCHVQTEWVNIIADGSACPAEPLPITAPPEQACTKESRPSVLVDVFHDSDGSLIPIGTDRAFYTVGDQDREAPATCLNPECSSFAAGRELEGTINVNAEVCGSVVSASVDVGMTADGCHVDTQNVILVANTSKCEDTPDITAPPRPECTLEARPSAHVFPVTDGGDVLIPFGTESVWYQWDGARHEAFCAEETEGGKCTWWITGYEQAGRFKLFTEGCDEQQSVAFTVPMTEDDCHVVTQFVPVFMDTTGCITSQPEGGGVPPSPSPPL